MIGTDFAGLDLNVSRETLDRLRTYEALLTKWNPAINLVSRSTIQQLWSRHFVDSAQIYAISENFTGKWVDLGSGGGFPGLVCAILSHGDGNTDSFVLVESDQRKATFLRTVARETDVPVTVISKRIEDIEPLDADILSARALAPLPQLLAFCELHLKPDGLALFPKGANSHAEISASERDWRFKVEKFPSITDEKAVVLRIGEIKRD